MTEPITMHREGENVIYITQTIADISADVTDQEIDSELVGGYLFSVELLTSADNAVTPTIKSALGTTMIGGSSVDATGGIYLPVTDRYVIDDGATYSLANLGSGTCTMKITVAKR